MWCGAGEVVEVVVEVAGLCGELSGGSEWWFSCTCFKMMACNDSVNKIGYIYHLPPPCLKIHNRS